MKPNKLQLAITAEKTALRLFIMMIMTSAVMAVKPFIP
jgi:hypothetical protein